MKRLSSHQTLALYTLVVALVFVAFVLGLMIGTGSTEREELRPAAASYEPAEDLDSQLDFYNELSKPIEEVKSSEPVAVPQVAPKPDTKPEIVLEQGGKPEKENSARPFTIQVAAYSTREEAEQHLLRLSAKGFKGRVRAPNTSSGDKYFRVWVGEFASSGEAEIFATQLEEKGFHTYTRRIQ